MKIEAEQDEQTSNDSLNYVYVDNSENTENSTQTKSLNLCNICGKTISEKNMEKHLFNHGCAQCMICSKTFDTREQLEAHKADHLNASFSCEKCDKTFDDAFECVVHNYKHSKLYSCLACSFATKHKHSMRNHIRRHEGKYDYFCSICGKGFLDKIHGMFHEEMHLDIKRYACEYCDKKFTVKRYLNMHKTLNHKKELFGVEETFQCDVCGRKFTFEASLRRHLSVIHQIGENRTVECPVCNKVIANNYNLKLHMRTHTGEKKYCCEICGKTFAAYKYWKNHTMRLHKENETSAQESIEEDEVVFKLEDDDDEFRIDDFEVDFNALD